MKKPAPVLSAATAARIADAYEAKGISPFGTVYGNLSWHQSMNGDTMGGSLYSRKFSDRHEARPEFFDAEMFALVDGLPQGWRSDVYAELSRRSAAVHAANVAAQVEAFNTTPAIKAFLRVEQGSRGFHAPKLTPMKGSTVRNYSPVKGCNARLKLSQAVSFRYTQESYADHSQTAVPVEGNPNSEACRVNLSRLCEAWRTHNGFAGSGCTYTASIHGNDSEGWFVVFDCRASISD